MTTTETLSVDLDHLLERLSNTLLSPTADDSELRAGPYQRTRVGANVEYARTLLLRLEHELRDQKTLTRKQSLQASLQAKRETIKRLNQRLLELNSYDDEDDDDGDGDSSNDEDGDKGVVGVREFAPAVQTTNGIDTDPEPSAPPLSEAPGLRARKPQSGGAERDEATTTALFGDRRADTAPASTGAILDDGRREQDLLTTSLVALARNLKQSSMHFSGSLEHEKEVLARAEKGLDKNAEGMDAAGRRMGALRRMTEGQGWWGRIKLYAIIAALWIAAFLLVFVGPKLRF